jgi:hypothetical protein
VHGIPSEFYIAAPARPVLWVAAAIALSVAAFAARRVGLGELRTTPAWLVVGSLLAVLPAGAAVPGGRALALAAPGFTAILAALLWRVRPRPTAPVLAALAALGFGQLVVSPLGRLMLAKGLRDGSEKEAQIAARWSAPCAPGELRVLLNAPDFAAGAYTPLQLSLTRAEPLDRFRLAAMAPIDVELSRSSDRSLRLAAVPGKAFFQSQWEQLHGPRAPRVGETGRSDGLEVRVSSADADARPTELEIITDAPASELCWLRWRGGTFERIELPPSGDSLMIRTEPGPLALPSHAE